MICNLQKVKLLIIDEVHLLNEERGAVIETIVARTLRQVSLRSTSLAGVTITLLTLAYFLPSLQVESSQSLIRIVGLSATLPNYVDVSDFLRVSRYHGKSRQPRFSPKEFQVLTTYDHAA